MAYNFNYTGAEIAAMLENAANAATQAYVDEKVGALMEPLAETAVYLGCEPTDLNG